VGQSKLVDIYIRKSGQDESQIPKGIKIKDDDKKIRIAGAVIRVTVMPRRYGNDYKISVWLPNGKQLEASDEHGYINFVDFAKGLVEAATGTKPKDGTEKKVVDINGFPAKISEREDDKTMTIEATIDPLDENYSMPKKEEVKPIMPQVQNQPSLPERIRADMSDANKQKEGETIEEWVARLQDDDFRGYA
jgi:hypothetical protein